MYNIFINKSNFNYSYPMDLNPFIIAYSNQENEEREDSAIVLSINNTEEKSSWIESNYSLSQQILDLFAIYKIIERKEIEEFILRNIDLVDFLHRSFNMIKKYFKCDANPFLAYLPEIYEETSEKLIIRINPIGEPNEILEKLRNFEENWIYRYIGIYDNRLSFNI